MKTAKDDKGNVFYLGSDVDSKIFKLESRIKELENDLLESYRNNRGGNASNLTPRQPKYNEQIQREIARRVRLGESKNKLSKEFNISRGTILNYCRKFGSEQPVKNDRFFAPKKSSSDELAELPKEKIYCWNCLGEKEFQENRCLTCGTPAGEMEKPESTHYQKERISTDPLADVPRSNFFGTKPISENFRDKD
jgi:hypothetical protein